MTENPTRDVARDVPGDVAVLVPAYQCAAAIAAVVAPTLALGLPVLVVDDGSSDDTAERAREAGAEVFIRPRNGGKGAALRSGLEVLLQRPIGAVLFMDADGQHAPADVPGILAAWHGGAGDFVIGARLSDRDLIPGARYWTNVIGARILSRMTGAEVLDSQSGFRLVSADLLRRVQPLESTGYAIETEILIKACRLGARLAHVRVQTIYGANGSHYRPVRDTFTISMRAIKHKVFG